MQCYQRETRTRKPALNRPVLYVVENNYDLWRKAEAAMAKQSTCVHEGAAKACHHSKAIGAKKCIHHHGMVFTFKCTGYRSQMFPSGR